MKYLYADSTTFPVNWDFLKLLDQYIDTSVKAITLENNVFKLKEDIKDRRKLKKSVLDEMGYFLVTVNGAISRQRMRPGPGARYT